MAKDVGWNPNGRNVLLGALAGFLTGIPLGIPMSLAGYIERNAAGLVGSDSLAVGWLVHLLATTVTGALYAALVWTRREGKGSGWGALYGLVVGILGPYLGMDLVLGLPLSPFHTAPLGPFTVPINLARVALHVVWGVLLGALTAWLLGRYGSRTPAARRRARPA